MKNMIAEAYAIFRNMIVPFGTHLGYNAYGMAKTTLETKLGDEALVEIARDYFGRIKTSTLIAEERGVPRQKVPRLAKAGQAIAANESGPQPSN